MQLNQLQGNTTNRKARRVGRGGKRGKTSGRGGKGQTARAGAKVRPEIRDIIKRLPKRRGYGRNRARTVNAGRIRPTEVNLDALEIAYSTGEEVSTASLVKKGVVQKIGGKTPLVKILGSGKLTKALTVRGCRVSDVARERITEVGGTIA